MTATTPAPIAPDQLLGKVEDMYRAVATRPSEAFHFETGRPLAERLGYPPVTLDRVPASNGCRSRTPASTRSSPTT